MLLAPLIVVVVWCVGCTCGDNVCGVDIDTRFHGTSVDCRRQSLSAVPDLPVPRDNVTSLLLGFNHIQNFHRSDFQNLTNLKHLDLRLNGIRKLAAHSFLDIPKLIILDLRWNNFTDWPNESISCLENLEELYLDNTIFAELGPLPVGFSGLNHMKHLSITALTLSDITGEYFHSLNVSQLTFLDLSQSRFQSIASGSFGGFHSLQTLMMNAAINISYIKLTSILTDLDGTPLHFASFFGMDMINSIDRDLFGSFQDNVLNTLVFSYSNISSIYDGAFENLQKLRTLQLDNNPLKLTNSSTFQGLASLTFLDMTHTKINEIKFFEYNNLDNLEILNLSSSRYLTHLRPNTFQGLPNLKELQLQFSVIEMIDNCSFCGLKSLERLSLAKINIEIINENAFKSLSKLRYLDMTSSGLYFLTRDLFQHVPSLERLILVDNSFNISNMLHANAFQDLTRLTFINMEKCKLSSDHDLFAYLKKVESIKLAMNPGIQLKPSAFLNNKHLRYLSISYNPNMTNIPVAITRISLDHIDMSFSGLGHFSKSDLNYMKSDNFKTISLAGNPFVCRCSQKEFVNWFNRTNKLSDSKSLYHCGDDFLQDYDPSKCINLVTLITSSAATFSLLLALSIFLIHRYRYTLSYKWYEFKVNKYRRLREEMEDALNLQNDAFISYGSGDMDFVLNKLIPMLERPPQGDDAFKLIVDVRDFPAGGAVQDNITACINNSRKTIFLVSESFLRGRFTMLEFNLAHSKLTSRHDAVILVLLEKIDVNSPLVPKVLKELMNRRTYIEWLEGEQNEEHFWKMLRLTLKRPVLMNPLVDEMTENCSIQVSN